MAVDDPTSQSAPVRPHVLSRLQRAVSAQVVYGEPVTNGATTVVGVAMVAGGAGYGQSGDDDGGGGFGLYSVPLGVFEVTDGASRFRPVHSPLMWAWAAAVLVGSISRAYVRVRRVSGSGE